MKLYIGTLRKNSFDTDFGYRGFLSLPIGKEKIKAGLGRTPHFSTQNATVSHKCSFVDGSVGIDI